MTPRTLSGVLLLFVLIPLLGYTQPQGVRIAKKSPWIELVDYDAKAKPKDGQGAGFYYLLQDEQENTITKEVYEHYAYSILTSEGLQGMSDLSFDFEPSYQQLTIHEINIIRNGTVISQLSKDIQVIQREQSLEYNLYDGTKTAIVNLKDVRVGDIVEYSITRKGYNPVFKGHIVRSYYFDNYYSLDKSFKRILLPASSKVKFKNFGGGSPGAIVAESNGTTDYRWVRSKIEATEFEYGIPAWHNASSMVTLSDFQSWHEVGEWARDLFAVTPAEREKLKKITASTFKSETDEDYILEVIRFVQDDVRYLGFETGINTHKPYPPSQIFSQRFGDCKDKSLLLTTLLEARNIEAHPVLVNTSLKESLDDYLPSGALFDHCVAQIVFNGKKIYIDPTISNQGGDLNTCYFPEYLRGLVIDNDIEAPDALPSAEPAVTTEIHDIEVLDLGGEATLSVRTSFTGSDADFQRSYYAQMLLESIQKNHQEYYANLYPDIVKSEEMKFTDNRKENRFMVEEKYRIPTFWKPVPNVANQVHATMQPLSVTGYFDVPKNIQQRTLPYSLTYPVDHYHTIHISLPIDFAVTPVDKIIETPYYQYESEIKKDGKEITKLTHYRTKRDYVPADQIQKYVTDHTEMLNEVVFQLTYSPDALEASNNLWPGILTTIASVVGGAILCLYLYRRYDPAPARYMVRGRQIQGWLFLLALGLVLSPLRMLADFLKHPEALTGAAWLQLLAVKSYGIFSFVFFLHIYNVVRSIFMVMLLVLFFQRRSSFPILMSVQFAVTLVIGVIDISLGQALPEDWTSGPVAETIGSFVAAAIWIPYLNISEQAKETFVIRGPHSRNDENDGVSPPETPVISTQEEPAL